MTELVPQNSGYMVAGYVVTGVILVGYTLSLWVRQRGLPFEIANRSPLAIHCFDGTVYGVPSL